MMLTCVYHPVDPCRVVEEDEAEALMASGFWFDCPVKAKEYRKQVEKDIVAEKAEADKAKRGRPARAKEAHEEK
jgi:hypothetical protein